MLAMAMHQLDQDEQGTATIHPDGEHAKRFDIPGWLKTEGFAKVSSTGTTNYGGTYVKGNRTLTVNPKSGLGDVEGEIAGKAIVVECKGGIINSRHAGQLSRLRKGLCEVVGLLMARPEDGKREIAAVPWTDETFKLATRMAGRCRQAGIEIALVKRDGLIEWIC